MAKHAARPALAGRFLRGLVLAMTLALVAAAGWYVWAHRGTGTGTGAERCPTALTVVTASSFAPVLGAAGRTLLGGANCVRVDIKISDGRSAAGEVIRSGADAWVPDDAAWATIAPARTLAPAGTAGSGQVLATSPFYMVTDRATGDRLRSAGGTWLVLANLAKAGPSGLRLVVRDPSASGDGMVAAGALGESVWLTEGMDASSLALAEAVKVTRTVTRDLAATPDQPGEVGLVPEYALLPSLPAAASDRVYLAAPDHTAQMRFTWQPVASAVADPKRAAALRRLLAAFATPGPVKALTTAGLRGPDNRRPAVPGANLLPEASAKPFDVLGAHHVQHVFATWDPEDRRSNLLVVVDISTPVGASASASRTPGSAATASRTPGASASASRTPGSAATASRTPGSAATASRTPGSGDAVQPIELLRQGCRSVADLLPDGSRLGLWEVRAGAVAPYTHRKLVPTARLDAGHRDMLGKAVGALATHKPGPGLYDTIVEAYTAVRDDYQPEMFNQVLVFTNDQNGDSASGTAIESLATRLDGLRDSERPVHLSVVVLGQQAVADRLKEALKPVDAYVGNAADAADIQADFIHVVAGGLHD